MAAILQKRVKTFIKAEANFLNFLTDGSPSAHGVDRGMNQSHGAEAICYRLPHHDWHNLAQYGPQQHNAHKLNQTKNIIEKGNRKLLNLTVHMKIIPTCKYCLKDWDWSTFFFFTYKKTTKKPTQKPPKQTTFLII